MNLAPSNLARMNLARREFLLAALTAPMLPSQERSQARSMVITRRGIAATSQTLASQAAAQVLARGGTAMDAAIAANAALARGRADDERHGRRSVRDLSRRAVGQTHGHQRQRSRAEGSVDGRLEEGWTLQHAAGWNPLGDRAGMRGRVGETAPAFRQAGVEQPVSAGDLLCSRRLPGYRVDSRNVVGKPRQADRRRQARRRFFCATIGRRGWARCSAIQGLAKALELVARDGARAFYRGPIAKAILADVAAVGRSAGGGGSGELRVRVGGAGRDRLIAAGRCTSCRRTGKAWRCWRC